MVKDNGSMGQVRFHKAAKGRTPPRGSGSHVQVREFMRRDPKAAVWPSLVAKELNMPPVTVNYALQGLIKGGWVRRVRTGIYVLTDKGASS